MLAASAAPVISAQPVPPAEWAAFTAQFERVAAEGRLVGGSTLLLRDGRVVARHHIGLADESRHQPVDDRTIFHWASITKTLTAIATMQLVQHGRLSLDARVTDYLPELRQIHGGPGALDSIRVWMLLAHASGLQNPTWPYGSGAEGEPFEPTRYEQLVAMMPYQRLHFVPGTRFGYSNPAYIYLARLIETLTGDPWAVYVQKNIWTPLGMTRSYVGATPYALEADRSNGYAWEKGDDGAVTQHVYGRDFDPGVTIPNSGWNAPLDDLATYARFLLGTPLGSDERTAFDAVLARETLAQMWQPRVPTAGGDGEILPGEAIGLGFFVCLRGADAFIGHTGEQAGYRAFLYINPATQAAVIGVFNTSDYAHGDAPEARFRALVEQALTLLR